MRQSESIAQLAADLAKAQGELKNATENAASNRNKYATLAQVRNCTAPVLSKHGLSMMQGTTYDGEHFILTTRLLHKSGEWIEGTYPLPIDKNSQLMGSAMTYGRRYCWTSMLGIDDEAAQDDDGEATRRPEQPERTTGISPHDFKNTKDDPSSAQSRKAQPILIDAMKANKSYAEVSRWWSDHQPEIKAMNTDARWKLFMDMIEYGLSKCDKPLAVNLFWSAHEPALNTLRRADHVKYDVLEEIMLRQADSTDTGR